MTAQSQSSNELLSQVDGEFQQLAAKHRELESRLRELAAKPHLSDPERLEEVDLKKRKLHLKDRMEDILRRRREQGQADPTQGTADGRAQSRG
jgi:uncharacterized protein